ncbi:TPR-like protein [Tothia fuscella]|uniref:TPR-like protein n=1 Tax=Tothia fuscella TaxID=1048955 RepID=A0A9P4NWM4_9PEZI|nr:TPR-like protein [Tothia fuscella]
MAPRKYKPRAAAELTPEFRRLNNLVTKAYAEGKYEAAYNHALEAIKLNPEHFPMHGIISEILMKKNRLTDALSVLCVGVHSTREPTAWWYVINTLNEKGPNNKETRQRLQECYSMLLDIDRGDNKARLGRMYNYIKGGQTTRAKNECLHLLKLEPYNTDLLTHLAEFCFSLEEPAAALPMYENFVDHCLKNDRLEVTSLNWQLLDFYVDLLIQVERYEEALIRLKTAARWLLGRGHETFWDAQSDDREWDIEDEPRRLEISEFVQGEFDTSAYGAGLMVELRAKLGLIRLGIGPEHHQEALKHFDCLEPEDDSDDAYVREYPEIFREIGDALRESELYQQALQYYEALRTLPNEVDSRFCFDIAICYQALGRDSDVRLSIQSLKNTVRDAHFYIGLAKLYQAQGKAAEMWHLINQLRRMGKADMIRKAGLPLEKEGTLRPSTSGSSVSTSASPSARGSERRSVGPLSSKWNKKQQKDRERRVRDTIIKSRYEDALGLQAAVDAGDPDVAAEWLGYANELFEDFRSQPLFFPRDKSTKFTGFNKWKRVVTLPDGENLVEPEEKDDDVPNYYRNISFDEWLDLLMRLALHYAKNEIGEGCWEVLNVTQSANIFAHEPARTQIVRNVALSCALILKDEQRLVEEARWFLKNFPFVSDGYRLFTAVSRYCRTDTSYYNSGPEQKFMLRQIKIMDFGLLPPEHRATFLFTDGDRVKTTEPTKNGNPHGLTEHDPAVLCLYGHMMFVAATYSSALTYYFRAYVIAPEDPIINLCIAISYVQMGYKRQSENRQYQIQQGLSFLFQYYDIRMKGNVALHMQEAEFNVGMMWHSLGLLHLALPAYERALQLSERVQAEKLNDGDVYGGIKEDFAAEAAYAIQTILVVGGDAEGARRITEQWLVL